MREIFFFDYAQAFFRARYDAEEIAYHTWYNSKNKLDLFQSFCKETMLRDDLILNEIDLPLLLSYRQFCLEEKGNSQVTINRKLLPIYIVIKRAHAEGYYSLLAIEQLKSLFCQVAPRRYGSEARRLSQNEAGEPVRYLNDNQLLVLLDYYKKLPDSPIRDTLDLFWFSFHSCGLRISDIITLEWSHVQMTEARLVKVMVKTKNRLIIPLSDAAVQILLRWRKDTSKRRFVFGLLPEDI